MKKLILFCSIILLSIISKAENYSAHLDDYDESYPVSQIDAIYPPSDVTFYVSVTLNNDPYGCVGDVTVYDINDTMFTNPLWECTVGQFGTYGSTTGTLYGYNNGYNVWNYVDGTIMDVIAVW